MYFPTFYRLKLLPSDDSISMLGFVMTIMEECFVLHKSRAALYVTLQRLLKDITGHIPRCTNCQVLWRELSSQSASVQIWVIVGLWCFGDLVINTYEEGVGWLQNQRKAYSDSSPSAVLSFIWLIMSWPTCKNAKVFLVGVVFCRWGIKSVYYNYPLKLTVINI